MVLSKDEIRRRAEIMLHWCDGGAVQYADADDEWVDVVTMPRFDFMQYQYRIKPREPVVIEVSHVDFGAQTGDCATASAVLRIFNLSHLSIYGKRFQEIMDES